MSSPNPAQQNYRLNQLFTAADNFLSTIFRLVLRLFTFLPWLLIALLTRRSSATHFRLFILQIGPSVFSS